MKEYLYELLERIDVKHMIVNSIVSIGLMSMFLTVFYFYYVTIIEEHIFENNIDIMVTSLMNSVKPFLTEYTKDYIQKELVNPDLKQADEDAKAHNEKIQNKAIQYMGIIFGACLVIGFGISWYFKINFLYILRDNLLLVAVLGLTEYTFLHLIAGKIISGDPNFIKYKVLVNLYQRLDIS